MSGSEVAVSVIANPQQLRTRWLGRLPFDEAWDLQRAIWEGKTQRRTDDDYLLLLEHPHVYTRGRNSEEGHLLIDDDGLDRVGAKVYDIDRGGDITYHGPGQLVGYPIVELADTRRIVPYVRSLEDILIRTLASFGVEGWREEGLTGVWTERGKVAAIGVRVSRYVSMHGFALNVDPDMSYFASINPCGITDRAVTSLSQLVGRNVVLEEVVEAIIPHAQEVFGFLDNEVQLGAFVRGQGRSRTFEVDELLAAGTFSADGRAAEPVTINGRLPDEPERPEWMKVTATMGEGYVELKRMMRDLDLNTVCEEAGCPNIYECWGQGTATLMILGDKCTRACGFCNVTTGKPTEYDVFEPFRAAEAVEKMGLRHAVITSVNRDDLDDGGSEIFAQTVREIHNRLPACDVEILIPDFKGDHEALRRVMDARPKVLNHNTETVLRLQRDVRTSASYGRSLALLARAKWINPDIAAKTGIIVGMGETREEVLGALADLRAVGVDIVTIGQYLRPTVNHRPIHRYVEPSEFDEYRTFGDSIGLPHVESGPLVRSSYHARDSLGAAGTSAAGTLAAETPAAEGTSHQQPVTIGGRR